MKEWKYVNELKSTESITPLSCRCQSSDQSLWGRRRWEATLPRCCWRPQQETTSTAPQWWWHGEDSFGTSANRDVRPPSIAWQLIPSLRRDPKTQRRKRTPSANTASGDADQKRDTPPACASTHFPINPCTCQPAHATRQKSQQGTPNYQLQTQLIRALKHRGLNQLKNGRQRLQRPDAKCPSPTFAWRPTVTRHAPRTQGHRNDEPLPTQQPVTKIGAAFQ